MKSSCGRAARFNHWKANHSNQHAALSSFRLYFDYLVIYVIFVLFSILEETVMIKCQWLRSFRGLQDTEWTSIMSNIPNYTLLTGTLGRAARGGLRSWQGDCGSFLNKNTGFLDVFGTCMHAYIHTLIVEQESHPNLHVRNRSFGDLGPDFHRLSCTHDATGRDQ